MHLRKIALHPLLVRSSYSDARLTQMVKLAHSRCVFKSSCASTRSPKSGMLCPGLQLPTVSWPLLQTRRGVIAAPGRRRQAACRLLTGCRLCRTVFAGTSGATTLAKVRAELEGCSDHWLHHQLA